MKTINTANRKKNKTKNGNLGFLSPSESSHGDFCLAVKHNPLEGGEILWSRKRKISGFIPTGSISVIAIAQKLKTHTFLTL